MRAGIGINNKHKTMQKYISNGFRAVVADGMREAGEVFAARTARQKYGSSGYVRTCNVGSYSQDGTLAEFSAFIGYTTGRNETTGGNVNFTVQSVGGEL